MQVIIRPHVRSGSRENDNKRFHIWSAWSILNWLPHAIRVQSTRISAYGQLMHVRRQISGDLYCYPLSFEYFVHFMRP